MLASAISYERSVPCIIIRQKGIFQDKEFWRWLDMGLEQFVKKMPEDKKNGWLVNLKEADATSEESMKWIAESPKLFK
ncbi:hypothetical protein LVD17_15020 [Fulvivirga ulvae]|uniref:hypothetical protein n=1 Tax=Fulvivirga ulvae TaxID=2904245 RepID=UPI001F2FE9A2|nr:hypothetical protein [Fulvivirga ulvae]UII29610.1 hypothetical protein LVD17_15020 [Fulvivirga ulvae]